MANQITTSSFKVAGHLANAVAISRGVPRGWKGRRYIALAPTWPMLKMSTEDYLREYKLILAQLDPAKVAADLDGAIMLCWEPLNVKCHRRFVAEWLETSCGLVVPEYGRARTDCLPFAEQPSK
ncbi:MAG: hypothetical protein WKF30_02395 [Pyrinomonadaceae bacterium]